MRTLIIIFSLFFLPASLAVASFEAAMAAYEDQDYATALQEFDALARAGDADAQYMLARLYTRGLGVVQDYVQAHRWFNIAAARGHRQAQAARDSVARQMTAEQIAEAQSLARTWQARAGSGSQIVELGDATAEQPTEGLVARIQLALNRLGYNVGMVNGQLNEQTRAAIGDYQMEHRLPFDAGASEALLEHLNRNVPAITYGIQPEPEPIWEWRRLHLRDNFEDGNFNANPAWQVAAGHFWIEGRSGLRSSATVEGAEGTQKNYSEIYLEQPIKNAFAIQLKLAVQPNQGLLELGPYQGAKRAHGYRLFFASDGSRGFALRRLTSAGSYVLKVSNRRFRLDDGRPHVLLWTRDEQGTMVVSLDGNELLRVADKGIKADFEGFTLLNRGSNYALHEISIHGRG